ncbi:MAG: GrpB family protein [Bacteroidota bacterium]
MDRFSRMNRPVIVLPYDPEWPKAFDRIAFDLSHLLAKFPHRIEHVGSTAVPGLAAKPRIDLDILVPDEATKANALATLEAFGFHHRGDLGIIGREALLSPQPYQQQWMDHNLYLCIEGIPAVQNHLGIRDYLRQHPEAVAEYSALKLKLAEQFPNDQDTYTERKTPFLLTILEKIGMSEADRKDIEDQNTL